MKHFRVQIELPLYNYKRTWLEVKADGLIRDPDTNELILLTYIGGLPVTVGIIPIAHPIIKIEEKPTTAVI
jgi:hypothetical protein